MMKMVPSGVYSNVASGNFAESARKSSSVRSGAVKVAGNRFAKSNSAIAAICLDYTPCALISSRHYG
jgi:hypothetical protein